MAAADLVVGRSGASVLEVAALGKPAVLVPYPYATAGHQLRNAEWMAAAGAAEIIRDEQLSGRVLRSRVEALMADRQRLADMARASAGLADRCGADRIADEIFRIARK
jgi:UDP-N-acetylglucosamine--N-acetylmuramyl-(pentapeptide) pyrophosphoryl-undecaprenol N-acetylglucosamine transferase